MHKQAVMSEELKKGLIIFAKRPVPGRVKTRLSPPLSPEQAAESLPLHAGGHPGQGGNNSGS